MSIVAESTASFRFWVRRPIVALAATLSLATGLAIATSIFAIADAALWQPLPLPEPHRVVWIDTVDRGVQGATSPGVFTAWQQPRRGVAAVGAIRASTAILRTSGSNHRLDGAFVSAGVMQVLGVTLPLGRPITHEDDRPGAAAVVVLSDRLWRTQFAAAPDIVGRDVTLGGETRTIVGVFPPEVDALGLGFDWWAPLALTAAQATNARPRYLSIVARLSTDDGETLAGELASIASAAGARGETGERLGVRIQPLKARAADQARPLMLPLLGAILSVLLLASLNAASLLLAQGQNRRAELAVRASLGASRRRLIGQLALESVWLTLGAGALSLLMSWWLIEAFGPILPPAVTTENLTLNPRSVAFTAALMAAVTILIGVVPALRSSMVGLRDALAGGARSMTLGPDRLRRTLVVLQVGLAVTIGAAGALMLRSTRELMAAPRGYQAEGVLTAAVQLTDADYPTAAALRTGLDRVLTALEAMPGKQSALATRVPLSGGAPGSDVALVQESFTRGVDRQVRVRLVSPLYFDVVGTPVMTGRAFAAGDTAERAPVVMVNQTLSRRLGGSAVIGRAVKFAVRDFDIRGAETPWTVVGVVADAHDGGPRAVVQPEIYLPIAQGPASVFEWIGRQVLIVTRPVGDGPAPSVAELRGAIAAAEPSLALYDTMMLGERMNDHLATERLATTVLVPLGVSGFLLAAFGIFALLLHMVTLRRRELAIRMALGATAPRVVHSLLGEGIRLTLPGAVLGCFGAFLASRAIRPLMFGVTTLDPLTIAALLVATVTATLLAIWIPARRAVTLDPATVLRSE